MPRHAGADSYGLHVHPGWDPNLVLDSLDFAVGVTHSLLHRFGQRAGSPKLHKTGNAFGWTDDELAKVEKDTVRPFSSHFLEQNGQRSVFWIESFYWGLRKTIEAALCEDQARLDEIEAWIGSGKFDASKRRKAT